MREKYSPTIKLYCMISNTDFVLKSMKYDLRKISFNFTSTTYTVCKQCRHWLFVYVTSGVSQCFEVELSSRPWDVWPSTIPQNTKAGGKQIFGKYLKCWKCSCISSNKVNWWIWIQHMIFLCNATNCQINNDDIHLQFYLLSIQWLDNLK